MRISVFFYNFAPDFTRMKIIGFISIEGTVEMVLKGDSCLLNNSKPFFVPDWTEDIRFTPCTILRVSRLGKGIAPKFAARYYDAIASGADFVAYDLLEAARKQGTSWTPALAFDYSLAIGKWTTEGDWSLPADSIMTAEDAIARASSVMTIRQGDLIYIQHNVPSQRVQREYIIAYNDLYCKIK